MSDNNNTTKQKFAELQLLLQRTKEIKDASPEKNIIACHAEAFKQLKEEGKVG